MNVIAQRSSVAEALVGCLADLGVRHAFGVSGGAIAPLWAALSASAIAVAHCRHESGAVFAAIEARFATNDPVAVFTTTGPGLRASTSRCERTISKTTCSSSRTTFIRGSQRCSDRRRC